MAKLLMTIPTAGGVNELTAMTAAQLAQRKDVNLSMVTGRPVDYVRNQTVDLFLKQQDFTHLFFVDSDTVPPLDCIDKLLSLNAPIVLGCYAVLMRDGLRWVVSQKDTDGHHHLLSKLEKKPFEVAGGGAGCLLIRRDVFEKTAWPWFLWTNNPDGSQVSEDIHFFDKAAEAGFKILAHPDVICQHYKLLNITRFMKG